MNDQIRPTNRLPGTGLSKANVLGVLCLLVGFFGFSATTFSQDRGDLLLKAVDDGAVSDIRRLAGQGVSVDTRDRYGRTALLIAVGYRGYVSGLGSGDRLGPVRCQPDVVKALLDLGADPAQRVAIRAGQFTFWDTPIDTSPLMKAAEMCKSDVIRELLRHKAPVNDVNQDGQSALAHAVLHRNLEAVTLLLDHGADPNILDKAGRTPLMYIIVWGTSNGFDDAQDEAVIAALVAAKARINARDEEGSTVLTHLARWPGYDSRDAIIRFLVERGADLCLPDKKGKRPIEWTTRESTRRLFTELHKRSACPEVAR